MDDAPAPQTSQLPPGKIEPTADRPGPPEGFLLSAPAVSVPKGGGAIRGIGEKFSVDGATGTSSLTVPIAASAGRSGFGPKPVLQYDSGNGNGPFGLGWRLDVSSISRTTERGLPRYRDDDTFLLRGAEDLVRSLDHAAEPTRLGGAEYTVDRYLPRLEGSFLLIERWTPVGRPEEVSWRTVSAHNVTTWYGRTPESRVSDPDDRRRIFQWLISYTHDDRGNVTRYRYVAENGDGVPAEVWEFHRPAGSVGANRYLKRVLYGNRTPYYPTMHADEAESPLPDDWMFELVLDYGDHAGRYPTPARDRPWSARPDAFSSHRAGFEVRTYRRCERVLMFHHFPEDPAVGAGCLVRSTDFGYADLSGGQRDPAAPGYSALTRVTHRSFARDGNGDYHDRAMPPVTFRYSEARIADVVAVAAPDLPNLPVGVAGDGYRWVDLDGEGLSGVLVETGGAWHYRANRGRASFDPVRTVARRPAMALLSPGRQQLVDLAGDGRVDLVDFGQPLPGYQTREGESWSDFVPFESLPSIDWAAENLRFVDLTGDGRADVLITEGEGLTWYQSLGPRGFDEAQRERGGPQVVFHDGTQTVFLADMCGDGLADIVRIRNGEVCYWPNLGYGRFGRRVALGNAPRFDRDDGFDPARIRLADVDGSGPTDILYLGRDGVRLYLNRSGNLLTDPVLVAAPVSTGDLASAQVVDLMGNGTGCLVWNSALPVDAGHPMRYMELMAPATPGNRTRKPHLLIEISNNMGASTEIEYTPSTEFYLRDLRDGRRWAGVLPFPVSCVSRVMLRDAWRRTEFTSTYSYHHGVYDGFEREFRGFRRSVQTDRESFAVSAAANAGSPSVTPDTALYQPPVRVVTWHHTGTDGPSLEGEYFTVPGHHEAPSTVEIEDVPEWREALRACKGSMLRQEVYELDADGLVPVRLCTVTHNSYAVRRLQPTGANRHAVFLALQSESVRYQHDLDLGGAAPDPRVTHTLNLRHDDLGRPQQAVTATYGRRAPAAQADLPPGAVPDALIRSVQSTMHVSYVETRYTTAMTVRGGGLRAAVRHQRLPLPYEVSTFDITGVAMPASGYLDRTLLLRHELCPDGFYPAQAPAVPMGTLPYHRLSGGPGPHRRLVQQTRTRYFDDGDDVASPTLPLALGRHGPRGLTFETQLLALTPYLLDAVLVRRDAAGHPVEALLDWTLGAGRTARDVLDDPTVGGYERDPDGSYWLRSGRPSFPADAKAAYYLPDRFTDPFGATTRVRYDPLFLYVAERTDPMGNTVAVTEFDLRVLAPRATVDANANREEVAFDLLGQVVAAGRLGKRVNGRWQGDDLTTFGFALANPAEADVAAFCAGTVLNTTRARQWLAGAGSRYVYHFGDPVAGLMPGVCTIARERYVGTLAAGQVSPLTVSLECTDGLGRTLMRKIQAEPDPDAPATPRWIVDGLTVVNNKGNPVRKYRPAFSADFGFQAPSASGPADVLHYDAAARRVRTEYADGTFDLVAYSPWHITTWDRNDTVLDSDWYAVRRRYDPADRLPVDLAGIVQATPDERAAWLCARHARTPSVAVLDSLGREVLAVAHNRVEDPAGPLTYDGRAWRDDYHVTFTRFDAEGKPLWVRDPNGNLVTQYITPLKPIRAGGADPEAMPADSAPAYDIAGTRLFQHGMDTGSRWTLHDAAGRPMLQWDVNERVTDAGKPVTERRLLATRHDALGRLVEHHLAIGGGTPALVELVVYRDTAGLTPVELDRDRGLNLIGRPVEHWDAAGRQTLRRADLAGADEWVTRTLVRDHEAPVVNWSGDRAAALAAEEFHQLTERDALGRVTTLLNWHRGPGSRVAVYQPRYNARGSLVAEDLTIGARKAASGNDWTGGTTTRVVREIRYDASGLRTRLDLGNGTRTEYGHDPATLRLVSTRTGRTTANPADLQDLRYTYDPVGNVTHVRDGAQDTVWFANQQVEPTSELTYDAVYRLTEATGRESAVAPAGPPADPEGAWPVGQFPAADTLRRYAQRYAYDRAGNLMTVRHTAAGGGWTRNYLYAYQDPAGPGSNRLLRTWSGTGTWDTTAPADRVSYRHDLHGNLSNLANTVAAADIRWDWRDMIRALDLTGGGSAYYTTDGGKQRVRKRIERIGAVVEERIYLDGFEWYRRTVGGAVREEIESHHLMDGGGRVLLVDDVLVARIGVARTLHRYQYGNHLGSTGTEVDGTGRLISHEEYHPYGTTAYRLLDSATEVPAKRYRYTGMERDEESGLSYHGARYLSVSLARWISADPTGTAGGMNLFEYAASNPLSMVDRAGRAPAKVVHEVKGDKMKTAGEINMTMERAAEAIRETYKWDDQEFAQQARDFYQKQFDAAYKAKANQGMKIVGTVWAAMAVMIVSGVVGGLVEAGLLSAAGGAQLGIGTKMLIAGFGGVAGSSVEVALEQGFRVAVGERQLTQGEMGARIGFGGAGNAVFRGAFEVAAKGWQTVKSVMSMGDELAEAAEEGLSVGARQVAGGAAGESAVVGAAGGIPRLTEKQLVARAEALFIATATERLKAMGRPVTQEAINAMKAWNTTAILQGTKDGKVVTLVAINQSNTYQYFVSVADEAGQQIVDPVVYLTFGPKGGMKMRHEHAEAVLYEAAEALGLETPLVASSNPGCWECQIEALRHGVWHANPRPSD